MANSKLRELASHTGLKTKTVQVPEWDNATVVLKEPFVQDWDAFRAGLEKVADKDDQASQFLPSAILIERLVFDEDGNPVFESGDAENILVPNYGPVHERLARELVAMSSMLNSLDPVGEAEKKSQPQTSDSE